MKSLKSLESYLDNLKKRMIQLTEIKEYDKRMEFMDSNIRIITSLIMQEMQNYIYNESMYLVKIAKSLTHRVKILITGMTALLIGTLMILMRRSFRLTDGITHPVTEMLNKVKKVGRGILIFFRLGRRLKRLRNWMKESIRWHERSMLFWRMSVRKRKCSIWTELQLIQAQMNPHFLYNTLDTIVWLIEGGMTEDAVDMISSLSVFFGRRFLRK